MDDQAAYLDFALLGHQDCWKKITRFINHLSGRHLHAEKVSEVYSFIPPRRMFDVAVRSITGQEVKGCYIETFIAPDELGLKHGRKNLAKVQEAATCAINMNVKIAALGGFTSIVLEGRNARLNECTPTRFTTGNSLTAVFIVKSLEKACTKFGKPLSDQKLLVIGATGDIGSACVQYFSGKVRSLLLSARQESTLQQMKTRLEGQGISVQASANLGRLLPQADLIISIASSAIDHFDPSICKNDLLICDAGYPRNLLFNPGLPLNERLYYGGMGHVQSGFQFTPSIHGDLYQFPAKNVAHGCMLEAVVLALEKQYLPFSEGRGNITPERMELIYSWAEKHGITEAPFFNNLRSW